MPPSDGGKSGVSVNSRGTSCVGRYSGPTARRGSRMRIALVSHVARPSGAEIVLERLATVLATQHEVHAIFFEDGPMVGRLRSVGATVSALEIAGDVVNARRDGGLPGRQVLRAVREVRRSLREIAPDVVHTHSLKSALVAGAAARSLRIPFVWHVHDRISADYLPTATVVALRGALRVLPDAVAGNSLATLETFTSRGVRAVVPNPVPHPPAGFRSREGRTGPPTTFGLVGRITPWKGQDVFLRAFASAFSSGPERAVLVGDAMFGEEAFREELERLVPALGLQGRVEFRGFRRDMWDELARLDVLVHASTIPEPFGLVVVEGLAAGLRVVAVDQGGPAEYLKECPDSILVPVPEPAVLTAALRRAASVPVSTGRPSPVVAAFDPERAASAILNLYEAAADQRRTGVVADRFRVRR